jgi:flagellar biosynthesis/type III secretory pathway chaperone
MEKPLNEVHQSLQRLIGLHRQLMDNVRLEREALVAADLKAIHDCTAAKQALIESIRQAEAHRMRAMGELAVLWRRPPRELTLSGIVIALQGKDPETADRFRSILNTLTVLIQRITEQNDANRSLVERSLEHVHAMKKNVLGESVPRSETYNPNGQKSGGMGGARLISKEA